MDRSQNFNTRRRYELLRLFFCRKLLHENLLSASNLYSPESIDHDRQTDTPQSENANSPLELNGLETPNAEPNSIQRLFNDHHSNSLTLQLENSMMVPKNWHRGVYSPIEVYIDSPSAIDDSGQVSTMLSSVSTNDDLFPDTELFEIDVLERINRLRRQGKWSLTRLPLCLDAPRLKTHFDYLLEECLVMQTDFLMERETKRLAAKMLAYEAKQYLEEKRNFKLINLCSTPHRIKNVSSKSIDADSVDYVLSNLPSSYIADLKSRLSTSTLFSQITNETGWAGVEKICDIVSSIKSDSLSEPHDFSLRIFMGTLRPYQKSALNWFIQAYDNSFGCILADDAKLGKKVQSLAFLAYLEEFSKINGPHLIVTDKSSNWIAAIERFLPYTTCVEYGEKIDNFNICLVDYETYFSDSFDGSFFQVQIIDQVEQLESLSDKSWDYLFRENSLHGDYRFRILLGNRGFLTSTFQENKFSQILAMLLKLLLPISYRNLLDRAINDGEIENLDSTRLISFIRSFEVSRGREDVSDQIPQSTLEVQKCQMTSKQRRIYEKLIQLPRLRERLLSDRPIQALDLLRKCCTFPLINEIKLPLSVSIRYLILRKCIFELPEFSTYIPNETLDLLQSRTFAIVDKTPDILLCCDPPILSKFQFYSPPVLANSPIHFGGKFECSLLTIWHQKRFKQLAKELFLSRSTWEDNFIAKSCLSLFDRDRFLLTSGKLQELLKNLAKVRKNKQRSLIFTAYESTQEVLCQALSHYNFTYMILTDDADRNAFSNTFNRNQRVACVLLSTRSSTYRLNLNNIGSVFVLETDLEPDYNDNIKRFFVKSIQSAGAKFYNLVTENSIETQTNLFDVDARSNFGQISRSISATINKNETKNEEQEGEINESIGEFTLPLVPICHDIDGVESTSDTLSSSGYEGSLDGNNSVQGESITYDRNFLESDSYLNSVFALQLRNNQSKFGFNEDNQIYDSLSNPWYTGDVIEPDEIEYTKMSPPEQVDEDTLFDFNDENMDNYIDSRALSPKSTDDLMDLTPPTSVDASRISTEFTLDPAIQIHTSRADHDHESRLANKRSAHRVQTRTDELRRRLLETQSIVLPDPEPIFRSDGKPGYIPQRRGNEWIDADVPTWSFIEDHALMDLAVRQFRVNPIPAYTSRNFCINWDLIAFGMNKLSFHDRSPSQCCNRFRELIAKKFAPVESPASLVEQFDEIDLSVLNDKRILSSGQHATRFFNKSVTTLARKIEDLKRVRNAWQSRTNWLSKCDDDEKFDILNRPSISETSNVFSSTRICRLMGGNEKRPSELLTVNKKGLPLDMVMVLHQYSRALRLSRVMTTAKSFMKKTLEKPQIYGRIAGYSKSISYLDRQLFVLDNDVWKIQLTPSTFNYHSHNVPKIQRPLESRLLWVDQDALSRLNSDQEQQIYQLLHSNFMQFTVDIRSNMLSSRKLTFDIIQLSSKFVWPLMPKRVISMNQVKSHSNVDVDATLLEEVKQSRGIHRILRNGRSLLPIQLENLLQNESIFYPPILPTISQSFNHVDSSIFGLLSIFTRPLDRAYTNDVYLLASLTEDLLFEWQDQLMNYSNGYNQLENNLSQRLFAKSKQTDVIIKIGYRPSSKKFSKNGKYVLTCVPGDHFELRHIEDKIKPELTPDACRLNSATLQYHQIQKYVNERPQKTNTPVLPLYKDSPVSDFAYSIRLSLPSTQLYGKRQKISCVPLKESYSPPLISQISGTDSQFLISQQKLTSRNKVEIVIEGDRFDKSNSKGIICVKGSTTPKTSLSVDSKLIDQFVEMILDGNAGVNVQNLAVINQIYKLSQRNPVYATSIDTKEFKLPRPTVDELAKIRRSIKDHFSSTDSEERKMSETSSVSNPLQKLIDEHYLAISTDSKATNKQVLANVALKLQLINASPQFFQILPNNPAKFHIDYDPNQRLLKLKHETPIQLDRLKLETSDGNKISFDMECHRLIGADSSLKKAKVPLKIVCPALKRPFIRQHLIRAVRKKYLERKKWLNDVKLRFLRLKHMEHKRQTLLAIDRMEKTIDQVLHQNNEVVESNGEITKLENKKTAIRRLLANSSTKFPLSLEKLQTNNAKLLSTEARPKLVDLLIQTTAKTTVNLPEKLHPNFNVIDPSSSEEWKDKSEILEISYKDVNKALITFDKTLENFFKKLNSPKNIEKCEVIESDKDIYTELISRSSIGPPKIIKYREPNKARIEMNMETSDKSDQAITTDQHQLNTSVSMGEETHSTPATPFTTQQNDPNRERSLPAIPSAMQIPVSAYHLKTEIQPVSTIQSAKSAMEPMYYTKRNLTTYPQTTVNSPRTVPAQTSETAQYPINSAVSFDASKRMYSKTALNRPVVRHVVVGNRPKMGNEQAGEEDLPYDTRYYQPIPGQRELTVREKLQQDMARGFVQTNTQKKMYPVRMPTNMKRRISENPQQDIYANDPASAPKRSRPSQIVYQVKGSASGSPASFQPQTVSSLGEQQSTSQAGPIIINHGEPIKTYIRRENHQFAIHDPLPGNSSVQRTNKAGNELMSESEKPSNPT